MAGETPQFGNVMGMFFRSIVRQAWEFRHEEAIYKGRVAAG
jgi:hypothetical protein